MRRRGFITLLAGAVAWPLAALAQQPAKLPTIGFLGTSTPSAWSYNVAFFVQRLYELGWIEGRNVVIEYRWAEGRSERFAEIAAEFARVRIVATSQNSGVKSIPVIRHPNRAAKYRAGPPIPLPMSRTWSVGETVNEAANSSVASRPRPWKWSNGASASMVG